ncbi:MAG: DUF4097 family beta strand repeat-containing protein [Mycobacterium sp.]
MRVLLVVIAALVSLCTLGSLGALAVELGGSRIITDTQSLPTGARSLTIDTGDCAAAVRLTVDADATEPRVEVRMVTRTGDTQLTVANDAAGSLVKLGDGAPGSLWWLRPAEMNVILPPAVAQVLSVTVNQQTGSLSTDANFDQLIAKIGDGPVTLGGSARRIDVNVRRGDISTSNPIAVTESFTANTESGDIRVNFRSAPRTTEAIAADDVTVGLAGPGPYRVRVQSEGRRGETRVTVPQSNDPKAPGVTARSESGNVTVAELR